MPWTPFLALTISIFFCMNQVMAQTSAASGQPSDRPGAPSGLTFHTNAKLVIVDVTVTDKQGHPVHNLKLNDFNLLENESPQTIKSFDEHVGLSSGDTAVAPTMPKLPPGVFSNDTPAPRNGAVNILLLDTLNTPLQDQIVVRQQLVDYLNKAKPGASVAIFGLTTQLILLQDFTSDPEVLKQAVKLQKNIKSSSMLDESVSGNGYQMKLSERMLETQASTMEAVAHLAQFETVQQSLAIQLRTRYTLDAMDQLARYLAGIPGRKNLIWFSGSFPIVILPDNIRLARRGADPFAGVASSEKEFRRTIDLLSRSQVAIYPVYAQGSTAPPMFSAENGGSNGGTKYTRNPNAFADDQTASFSAAAADHSTMQQLADGTGGEAFVDTNDLSDAVKKAIDKGSNYYTLTYTPANNKWMGESRSIQVNLQQRGYTLSYRRSYFAADPATPAATKSADAAATAPNALESAIKYGAPAATQILFKSRVLPVSNAVEKEPAPGNTLDPDPKKNRSPYRRYAIDYLAEATAIEFARMPDGGYRDDLDYVVCVYDLHGELINIASTHVAVSFTPAQYASLLQRGLPFHQEVSVPIKGGYVLRIAIQDHKSDRIGAVDVPLAAVADLPPLVSAAPSAH